jgi:predicted nucleic acid-binding protein
MILVDTNVWSELARPAPSNAVLQWEKASAGRLWLSTVVIGELLSGVELMPAGRRQEQFRAIYAEILRLHADRIAPFDLDAARCYGSILAVQERAGRNPGTADTQIAATAILRGMSLATRNTRHFEGLGLNLIDPWAS